MTTRHEADPSPRWLIAAGVCAALLAQMALPALHALETEALESRAALAWQVASDAAPGVAPSVGSAPAHDPATCPVCRSLLRTGPVATPLVSHGVPCSGCSAAPPAPRACACSAVALTGHPPRAPPARALHLA